MKGWLVFASRYTKEVTVETAERILRECGPGPAYNVPARPESSFAPRLEAFKLNGGRSFGDLVYPITDFGPIPTRHDVIINPAFQYCKLPRGLKSELPAVFSRERKLWATMVASRAHVRPDAPYEVMLYIDVSTAISHIIEAEFGFASIVESVFACKLDDPSKKAWPVMYFGHEMVKEHGKVHLLEAPVEVARELPGGEVLLQVKAGQIKASKSELRPLAKHLDLQV